MVQRRHSSIPKPDIRSYSFGFNGKEKLNEAYGEGNGYDFGARIYDPRIGRWLSTDPLASKYPHFSPYSAFENNPIYFNDLDGKDGHYTIDGNTITFHSQIYISGVGATKAKAGEIQNNIMGKWGGDHTYKDANGKVYNVKFDIKVTQITSINKSAAWDDVLNGTANSVTLVDPSNLDRSYVNVGDGVGGKYGKWKNSIGNKATWAHETGHFLKLDDTYYDVYGNGSNDGNTDVHSQNYSSTEKNDVMGVTTDYASAKITQGAIDALANYALTNPSNVTGQDGKITGTLTGPTNLNGPEGAVRLEKPPVPIGVDKNQKN